MKKTKNNKKDSKGAALVFDDERKKVWAIMSELFLDTELSDEDIERIAESLNQTSYSVEKLVEIFEEEVAPALHINLQLVAGVWTGFKDDEVEKLVSHRLRTLQKQVQEPLFLKHAKAAVYLAVCKDDWEAILYCLYKARHPEAEHRQPE